MRPAPFLAVLALASALPAAAAMPWLFRNDTPIDVVVMAKPGPSTHRYRLTHLGVDPVRRVELRTEVTVCPATGELTWLRVGPGEDLLFEHEGPGEDHNFAHFCVYAARTMNHLAGLDYTCMPALDHASLVLRVSAGDWRADPFGSSLLACRPAGVALREAGAEDPGCCRVQ